MKKESDFFIQKVEKARKCIPLMPASCCVLSQRHSLLHGWGSHGWPQPIRPLQIHILCHRDKGNESDLEVICMQVIVKAVEVDRIKEGDCEKK